MQQHYGEKNNAIKYKKMKSVRYEVMFRDVTFAAVGIVDIEVPVARFTLVTDPALYALLALTQSSALMSATSAQWIAVHLLCTSRIATALCKQLSNTINGLTIEKLVECLF